MLLFTVRHAKKSGILVPVGRGSGGWNTGQPSEASYFVTPVLGLIQVIGKNASYDKEFCTFWSQMLI